MRDCLKNRAGYDRGLMTVGATFLTVWAASAFARDEVGSRAAGVASEAATPRPEPANVPPPTIGDFKMDTTASVPEATKVETPKTADNPESKPSAVAKAPAGAP